MSYAALATDRYDEMVEFYGGTLGFPVVDSWDRPGGRDHLQLAAVGGLVDTVSSLARTHVVDGPLLSFARASWHSWLVTHTLGGFHRASCAVGRAVAVI